MNEYVVRLWVDFKVKAPDEAAAKKKVHDHPLVIEDAGDVELYDMQVADARKRETES